MYLLYDYLYDYQGNRARLRLGLFYDLSVGQKDNKRPTFLLRGIIYLLCIFVCLIFFSILCWIICIYFYDFFNTAKPVGLACLCNALYHDTCNALHRYKKA